VQYVVDEVAGNSWQALGVGGGSSAVISAVMGRFGEAEKEADALETKNMRQGRVG
jgi:hypothetical protein